MCIEDVINGGGRNKVFHPWGQGKAPFIKLIEAFTNPNDFVCDPCFGGGTTIEACIETNRNCYGFEIDKKYFDLLSQRIGQEKE